MTGLLFGVAVHRSGFLYCRILKHCVRGVGDGDINRMIHAAFPKAGRKNSIYCNYNDLLKLWERQGRGSKWLIMHQPKALHIITGSNYTIFTTWRILPQIAVFCTNPQRLSNELGSALLLLIIIDPD
jgi:hypothetical protein